jgi:phosphoribosylglycinamide formyltransferase-1
LNHTDFDGREDFDREMIRILREAGVDLIVLAGFMRILTPSFLQAFPDKIINIHPALLPAFPGTHVQQQALDYGVRFSGCTVHFVDEGVDTGPIIIQAVVPVHDGDTAETLAARILKEEHKIYPQAIRYFAEGRIIKNGRRVKIKNAGHDDAEMHNPPLDR